MPSGTRTTEIWRNRILVSAITDACWSDGADLSLLRQTMDLLLVRNYLLAPCLSAVLEQMAKHHAGAGQGREDRLRSMARKQFAIDVMGSGRLLTARDEVFVKALSQGPTTLAS